MNNSNEDRTAATGDEVESAPAPAPATPDTSDTPTAGGEQAPTFAEMGLAPAVAKAVADVGYEVPSAIQAATIPLVMEGRDVVGLAQTGTGKTAAFALPILR